MEITKEATVLCKCPKCGEEFEETQEVTVEVEPETMFNEGYL